MQQQIGLGQSWIAVMFLGMFAFAMVYVQATGHGLGDMPQPVASSNNAAAAPGQALAASTTESNPILVAEGGAPLTVGSPEWIENAFRTNNLLSPEEHLVVVSENDRPGCKFAVVGPSGVFLGRVCEDENALYRVGADGKVSLLRLSFDEHGNTTVLVVEPERAAGGQNA